MRSPIELLDAPLFASLEERARQSPRLRVNHDFHPSMEDNPHRFLNVMRRGTYVTPHRHLEPPKSETFVVLEGQIAFFVFDDGGTLMSATRLGAPGTHLPCGIDILPGIWHSLAPLSDHAVCFEVKPGPYVPATDKSFAPWAPREGDPSSAGYLARLMERLDSP